ncbi:MAG: hypothetical protein JXB48_15295 [Candidatus Latescibacteria bacterium]|nr:hypothetical protein [Candidatus Latescibacterota bacterium]
MKILFVLFLLVFPFFTYAGTPYKTNEFLLQKHNAGSLKIGMTVDELFTIYGLRDTDLVDLYIEGSFTPAIEIYLQTGDNRKPSLVAEFRGDRHRIWLININDKRFKTDKGIGIGSSLGDVRKAYTVNRIDWGERGFFARVDDVRMTVIFDNLVPPPEWYEEKNPDLMPDDAIISTIYLD